MIHDYSLKQEISRNPSVPYVSCIHDWWPHSLCQDERGLGYSMKDRDFYGSEEDEKTRAVVGTGNLCSSDEFKHV